jgi:hypothetical protein
VGGKKVYMCGDRACIDKKEFKQYFSENLIVEIQSKVYNKESSVDLIKLNISEPVDNKKILKSSKTKEKLYKNEQKILNKIEKSRIKKERKTQLIEDKKRIKEEAKLAKLLKKTKKKKLIFDKNKEQSVVASKISTKKKDKIKDKLKTKVNKISESKLQTDICVKITNCDIDQISELLIKKGREKDFPNITAK